MLPRRGVHPLCRRPVPDPVRGAEEADLERYLSTHAARMRSDFAAHFPQGDTVSREVWMAIQAWERR